MRKVQRGLTTASAAPQSEYDLAILQFHPLKAGDPRSLAPDVENAIYAMLSLDSIASLYYCSHSAAQQMVRFLNRTPVVTCSSYLPTIGRVSASDSAYQCGLNLAARECRMLQRIKLDWRAWYGRAMATWLNGLIRRNVQTLRCVDMTLVPVWDGDLKIEDAFMEGTVPFNTETLRLLLTCPKLESFAIPQSVMSILCGKWPFMVAGLQDTSDMPTLFGRFNASMDALTASGLPNLKSLRLCCDSKTTLGNGFVDVDKIVPSQLQTTRILSQGSCAAALAALPSLLCCRPC
jgi:hypothetical protein